MNYSKISGQFVCKMAMLLAFVFAACSEDNSPMNGAHGGAAEEQGYYALAGRLGDVYPKLLLGDSIGDTSSHGNLMLAPKGASIIVYELDSLTFDTTGRSFVGSVDDDEGHFVFNSLDLSSPYVLIDEYVPSRDTCRYITALLPLEDRCFEYTIKEKQLRAIVDLRKNEKISVNSLTSAKVPLLQGYLAEGMTFAEANQMAERKILEDLGIFEDLGSFEEMFDDDSELSYVNKLVQYTEASVRDGLEWGDVVDNYVSPQKFVGRTQMEKYFRNQLQVASCIDVYTLSAGGLPDFEPSGYEPLKNDEFMYYKKASSTDPNDKNSIMFIRFDEDGGAKFHTVLMVDDVKDVSITICPIDYAKAYAGGTVDLSNMPFKFIYNIDATDYHYNGGLVLGNTRVEDGENLEYFNEVADSAGSKRNLVSLKWGSMANNDNNKCILFHSAETEVEEEPSGT